MKITQKLDKARELLEEVQKTLNVDSTRCNDCGTIHYTNWSEHKANEALKAAITRITKVSSLLPKEDD